MVATMLMFEVDLNNFGLFGKNVFGKNMCYHVSLTFEKKKLYKN